MGTQVPIQVYGIPGRYAGALYMAGSRADVLEDLEEDLIQARPFMALQAWGN